MKFNARGLASAVVITAIAAQAMFVQVTGERNPGLKLANAFGVNAKPRQTAPVPKSFPSNRS